MTDGPGHYDADGAYVFGEADAAAPNGRFSDLLNKGFQSIKQAARNIAITTLSEDSAPAEAAALLVPQAIEAADIPGTVRTLIETEGVPGMAITEPGFALQNETDVEDVYYPPYAYLTEIQANTGRAAVLLEYSDDEVGLDVDTHGRWSAEALNGLRFTSLAIIGDSIAERWEPWQQFLETATRRYVDNYGIGGQRSTEIYPRFGASFVTVAGGIIPTLGNTATVTSITDAAGNAVSPLVLTYVGSRNIVVQVGGTTCRLVGATTNDSTRTATYTLTRLSSGVAMPCPPGTPMLGAVEARDHLPIVLAPRNDLDKDGTWRAGQSLAGAVERVGQILDHSRKGQDGLVLGMLPWADETSAGRVERVAVEAALRTTFPRQWLDWGAWLRTDEAFAAADIAKTAQDVTDIANGVTPTSFREPGDLLHIDQPGYRAATPLIAAVLNAKGLNK